MVTKSDGVSTHFNSHVNKHTKTKMPCASNATVCGINDVPELSNNNDSDNVTAFIVTGAFAPQNLTSTTTQALNTSFRRDDPVMLDQVEVISTIGLSVLAIVGNALVLFVTKFTGGGACPTMVFVRTFCVADLFVGFYGLGKMTMFFFVDNLMINFFLPECILFTATTAACLCLLFLNVERGLKVSAPFWYALNVEKSSVITAMVFLWNVSFVLGFLPLLGWNSIKDKRYVYDLFLFMPSGYLLMMTLLWTFCVVASVVSLVLVRRRCHRLALLPQHLHHRQESSSVRNRRPLIYHLSEIERYWRLRASVIVDLVLWVVCFVPFFFFLGLSCRVCPLDAKRQLLLLHQSVYHFVPVFMLRSLAGAGIQLYRTLFVQGLGKLKRQTSMASTSTHYRYHDKPSNHNHHQQPTEPGRQNGLSAISYCNPMCESVTDVTGLDDGLENFILRPDPRHQDSNSGDYNQLPRGSTSSALYLLHRGSDSSAYNWGNTSSRNSTDSGTHGISNPAYRPSVSTVDLSDTQSDLGLQSGLNENHTGDFASQAPLNNLRNNVRGFINPGFSPSIQIHVQGTENSHGDKLRSDGLGPELDNDLRSEFSDDLRSELGDDFRSESGGDVKSEDGGELRSEVGGDIRSESEDDFRSKVRLFTVDDSANIDAQGQCSPESSTSSDVERVSSQLTESETVEDGASGGNGYCLEMEGIVCPSFHFSVQATPPEQSEPTSEICEENTAF